MAIDSMLDMSEKEQCVDIFGYVTLMRTCRPSMVQTQVCSECQCFLFCGRGGCSFNRTLIQYYINRNKSYFCNVLL